MSDDIFEALFGLSEFENDFRGACDFGVLGENIVVCTNLDCGGTDFDVDEHRGDYVCLSCGACFGGLLVGVDNRKRGDDKINEDKAVFTENARNVAFDSIGVRSAKLASGKKDTYRRKTYFRDRMSQWLQSEKPIPKKDWHTIKREWRRYLSNKGIPGVLPTKASLRKSRGKIISGCHPLEKADIRCILRACDVVTENERQEQLAQWPADSMWDIYREDIGPKAPSFVTRYLEKWLSLRWRFTGVHSTAAECPHRIFETLEDYFEKLDKSFPSCIQNEKRKSFPSYNEMVKNLLQLLFLEHLGSDFPGLRTERARNKANFYWWQFCRYHKWPYLLKEAKFLKRKNKRA